MNIANRTPGFARKRLLATLVICLAYGCPGCANSPSANSLATRSYSPKEVAIQADQELEQAARNGPPALLRLLKEPFPLSLEAPLGGESQNVYQGISLPTVVYETALPFRLRDSIIFGERFGGSAEEFKVARRTTLLISELEKNRSTGLVEWLASRCNDLPPSPRDVIAYAALGTGMFPAEGDPFWRSTAPKWHVTDKGLHVTLL